MGIFDSVANVFGASTGGASPLGGGSGIPAGVEQYSKMQGV